MSSQQLLQELGAKSECGPATLLQTEAVGTGELGHGPQLHGHVAKLKIRMEKQWNEDDGTKRTSEDVNKKGREGEKTRLSLCIKT